MRHGRTTVRTTRTLSAALAAGLLAAAGLTAAAPATADTEAVPGSSAAAVEAAATRLTASNFRYGLGETSPSLISALDSALPNVSVSTVANDGNRTGATCGAPSVSHRRAYFCWNSGDQSTSAWYPQGITTSSDAYGAGTYEGKRILVASWYDHDGGIDKGARLSFVDLDGGTSNPSYRHVLLVEPTGTSSSPSYRPVSVHAGGLAWYGNHLYVADTSGGFRVFDLDHLWRVSTGSSTKIGRQSDGSYHAFDYKYVLPQTAKFSDYTVNGYAQIRHSSVSLDRSSTPDSLIVTEYQSPSAVDGGTQVRTIRIPIDYRDRYLKPASDGVVKATEAYRIDLESVQGSTALDGEFYYSQSDGSSGSPNSDGDLYTFAAPSGSLVRHGNALTMGPEDLSYDPTRDHLWTLSEYPGHRWVYATDASSY
ncbi:hypothetical protein [Myceligenerans pegani]|uniref:Secreted protein n=1 Tax=Myceligenerans pegani TaxID=2776917 RepID=A0ABR9MYM5_9MICO|nr:hypothetical protein [Myceligenerans sp. TRM 65318]MBE1876494.1 hypothetical protein [Myceligenerans sp. TRM 65318]MBE3018765.1 hypothetical protein [Myceligenerans sp. TRM 65318]